ncbi:MAG: hypothetical protein HY215_00200 [Candidatus Rokubacteria bacterium]|nr:hypothetical protein [Candidatus Rokubacteria bacterium]
MATSECTLFRGAHKADPSALKLQAWTHLYKAFTEEGATPDEFLAYLEKNGLAKGRGCSQYVASLLESMLDLTGEKRVGRLPNGRFLAVYAAGTRRGETKKGTGRQPKDRRAG